MAVTTYWFGNAPHEMGHGNVDFDADTIKCALFTNAHAPDQDDDYYGGSHGMTEVAQAGTYVTGGATLSSKTLTYASNVTTFDAADVTWAAPSGITARYACIYDSTPDDKPFLWWIDFGGDEVCTGKFTITLAAAGIATMTVTSAP